MHSSILPLHQFLYGINVWTTTMWPFLVCICYCFAWVGAYMLPIYGECPKVRRIVTSNAGIWDKKWIGFYLYVVVTTKPLLFFSLFFSNVNVCTPSFMACFTLKLNHNKCDVLYFQIYMYTQLTSEILCACCFPFTFHIDFVYMAILSVCFHYI